MSSILDALKKREPAQQAVTVPLLRRVREDFRRKARGSQRRTSFLPFFVASILGATACVWGLVILVPHIKATNVLESNTAEQIEQRPVSKVEKEDLQIKPEHKKPSVKLAAEEDSMIQKPAGQLLPPAQSVSSQGASTQMTQPRIVAKPDSEEAEAIVETSPRAFLVKPTPIPGKFRVDGIIYDVENPLAVVNGQLVSVGQRVNGNRILRISERSVQIEGLEEPVYLKE